MKTPPPRQSGHRKGHGKWQGPEIAVLIGAEGGFDEDEVALAREHGCHILSLGKRILRCETAPLAALTILMYETGNME